MAKCTAKNATTALGGTLEKWPYIIGKKNKKKRKIELAPYTDHSMASALREKNQQ